MKYQVGDTVVYPRHGAARVTAIGDRTLRGVVKKYIKLQIISDDPETALSIELPVENLDKVGVRDIVDASAITHVFEILRTPIEEEKTNWSRRYKLNVERIDSGDVNEIASVIRDLSQRDDLAHGLSAGEKRMLVKARQELSSEIALAEHLSTDQAEHLLDVNLGYADPTADDLKHHAKAPAEKASETLDRIAAERRAARKKARAKAKSSRSAHSTKSKKSTKKTAAAKK
jgi:CarD family transcriptional regulator